MGDRVEEPVEEPKGKPNPFARAWNAVSSRSRLSLPQLAATALAAITMAVISSRLSSFSSSILIAGLIAVVSAVSSEFYRIVLTTSAEKTKEVVVPALSEVKVHRSTDTEVMPSAETGGATAAQETAGDEEDLNSVTEGASTETVEPVEGDQGSEEAAKPSVGRALFSALAHNQVVQMSLVFFIVALITVGVSYGVARAQGGTHYNTFTTVQQSLSDEEKQALLDAAAAQLGQEGTEQTDADVNSAPQTNPDKTDIGAEEEAQETTEDKELAAQITSLQQENEELRGSLDDLAANLASEQETIANLTARLEALEAQLAQQQTPSQTAPTE